MNNNSANPNSTSIKQAPQKRDLWYRNPWVLLILLIPLISIIASVNMLRLASKGSDSAPHHFWQKEGLGIQGEERLLEVAAEKQLEATLQLDHLTGEITVKLNHPVHPPLRLLITHATIKSRDQLIRLTPVDDTQQAMFKTEPHHVSPSSTYSIYHSNLESTLDGKYTFYLYPNRSSVDRASSTNLKSEKAWLLKAALLNASLDLKESKDASRSILLTPQQ